MADLTAQRTLVKSPPELWSELSEVESLARHLGELGEIRITKVEPETTVAWEGEQISGTVELEQSGWGTRVTFHATVPEPDPAPESEPEPAAAVVTEPEALATPVTTEPEAAAEPEPEEPEREEPALAQDTRRRGFWSRWLFRERRSAAIEPVQSQPEPVATAPEPVTAETEAIAVEPEPVAVDPLPPAAEPATDAKAFAAIEPDRVQAVLDGTLEALGQAHHRPFSRG
jgi:hypothetical protein